MRRSPRLEEALPVLYLRGLSTGDLSEALKALLGRESTESWASRLRDLKRRSMPAPVLAVGDSGLGFWAALREVYLETQEQRRWRHKIANVLDKLPKRLRPRAKAMLHEVMKALDHESALEDIDRFSQEYGARYPKTVEALTKNRDQLLTLFDFPAEHWIHLRTTNSIESPFATVKARAKKTKALARGTPVWRWRSSCCYLLRNAGADDNISNPDSYRVNRLHH